MDKEQASKEIAERCVQMRKLFDECIAIAVEGKVSFDLPWGGEGTSSEDGYGVGATYYPAGVDDWNKRWGNEYSEWVSSSQTC